MKKFVSIFIVIAICLAMIPLQVFAEECHEHSKGCSHNSGYYTKDQVTYVDYNSNYHRRYVTRLTYCKKCNALLGARVLSQTYGSHSFGVGYYVNSTHIGDYSGHYYTYRHKCQICNGTYTYFVKAACTPHVCIDPQ